MFLFLVASRFKGKKFRTLFPSSCFSSPSLSWESRSQLTAFLLCTLCSAQPSSLRRIKNLRAHACFSCIQQLACRFITMYTPTYDLLTQFSQPNSPKSCDWPLTIWSLQSLPATFHLASGWGQDPCFQSIYHLILKFVLFCWSLCRTKF